MANYVCMFTFEATKWLTRYIKKNLYKCIGFLYKNYKQQAYSVKDTQYNDTMACVN